MERLLNSIFLISGTAIGAGLIALPLTSVNLGMGIVVSAVCFAVFYAYHSSMMTINLNRINKKPASIVDLSQNLSGSKTCLISMISCLLPFSLLTAYFSGVASTLSSYLGISNHIIVIGCSVIMFIILNLKYSLFSRLNSVLVTMLLIIIVSFIIFVCTQHMTNITTLREINNLILPRTGSIGLKEITLFLPIILTSFGVQNICHQVYEDLNGDPKKIKIAFLIGVLIPALLYTGWIFGVFENILARDVTFFEKLQQHQVSVGELIEFLCASSKSKYVEVFSKY